LQELQPAAFVGGFCFRSQAEGCVMRCGTAWLRLNARSGSQKRVCIGLIPIGIAPIPIDFALIPIGIAPIPIDFALIPIGIAPVPIGIRAKQAHSAALAASILPAQAAVKQNNSALLL